MWLVPGTALPPARHCPTAPTELPGSLQELARKDDGPGDSCIGKGEMSATGQQQASQRQHHQRRQGQPGSRQTAQHGTDQWPTQVAGQPRGHAAHHGQQTAATVSPHLTQSSAGGLTNLAQQANELTQSLHAATPQPACRLLHHLTDHVAYRIRHAVVEGFGQSVQLFCERFGQFIGGTSPRKRLCSHSRPLRQRR